MFFHLFYLWIIFYVYAEGRRLDHASCGSYTHIASDIKARGLRISITSQLMLGQASMLLPIDINLLYQLNKKYGQSTGKTSLSQHIWLHMTMSDP